MWYIKGDCHALSTLRESKSPQALSDNILPNDGNTSTLIGINYRSQSVLQHGSEQFGESQGKGTVPSFSVLILGHLLNCEISL